MPLRKDSLSGPAGLAGSKAGKTGKSKAVTLVAGVGVVMIGAVGFVIWKKHHEVAAYHPAPMTVSTVPHVHHAGPSAYGSIQHGSRPAPAGAPSMAQPVAGQSPSGFVNATPLPGGAVTVTPNGSPVPASPVAQVAPIQAPVVPPNPAALRASMLQQNQAYYSQSENMARQISLLKLQLQMKELEDKINGDSSSGSGSSVSLPPPPSAPPAAPGKASASSLAQSISIPLPVANQAPADEVLSIAHGSGGAAAVVRVGGLQYTVRAGEWVGGMKVVAITHHEVILAGGGARKVLTVGS